MVWIVAAYSQELMENAYVAWLAIAPGLVSRFIGADIATVAHTGSFGWCFERDSQRLSVELFCVM